MTSLEIYVATPNGDVEWYAECKNSWGGAMHIWSTYARLTGLAPDEASLAMLLFGNDASSLWACADRLPVADQWMMRSTYDMVMVRTEDLPTLIAALTAFVERYPTETLRALLVVLAQARDDPNVRAVGFNQTSVNSNPWRVPAEEDEGEERPLNIDRDTHAFRWLHERMAAHRTGGDAP